MLQHGRLLVMGLAAICLAMPARVCADASNIEVRMEVVPPDRGDPRTADGPPQIEATVIGAPNLPADKFTLREDGAQQPVALKPTSRREYTQGSEKLAIAIVMNGWEIWIGNDDVVPEGDPSRFPGVLKALEAALDRVSFKDAGPPGSLGMVITYGDTATIRIPMGPLDRITGSALGTQRDYFNTQGVELVKGVDLALSELHKVLVAHKVLIVVSDGLDKNMDAARIQLAALKARAAADKIETFAILYKGAMSSDGNVISTMIAQTQTVNTADNIATAIQGILARMADRQYLTFPGFDPKLRLGLPWDGKPHHLILRIDQDDADPVELALTPPWRWPTAGFPWLIVIGGALGALVLVGLGAHVFRRKPQPLPPPLVAAVAPPPVAPPGRHDTVRIDTTDFGFPIVGWLVPRIGPQTDRTFKLRPGVTRIGSAPPCDIIIDDPFVGSEHCQIITSPQGFCLVDTGSVNGSFVNRRKIDGKHDLVDNDEITIGKTSIVFKSLT